MRDFFKGCLRTKSIINWILEAMNEFTIIGFNAKKDTISIACQVVKVMKVDPAVAYPVAPVRRMKAFAL